MKRLKVIVMVRAPKSLDLDELKKKYPTDDIPGFHDDKVHIICDNIYRQSQLLNAQFRHPEKGKPHFVPLNSRILRKQLGSDYKTTLDWMLLAEVLETDNSYRSKAISKRRNAVSKGYKFAGKYQTQHRWVQIKKPFLIKKLSALQKESKPRYYEADVVNHLQSTLTGGHLAIDKVNALFWVECKYQADIAIAQAVGGKKGQYLQDCAESAKMMSVAAVEDIDSGNLPLAQDEFGYRAHSSLTRLPRELRQFVTYDNKPLVEVDISGSQLLMATWLLDWRNYSYGDESPYDLVWEGVELGNKGIESIDSRSITLGYTIMWLEMKVLQYGPGLQNHPFYQDASSAVVYEKIVSHLDGQGYFTNNEDEVEKRAYVKDSLLSLLFADPHGYQQKHMYTGRMGMVWKAFEHLYPEIAHLFGKLKKYDYKDLCKLLQRVESTMMLGHVVKRLHQEHPSVPVMTIHDCIVTTAGNEDIVAMMILDCMLDFLAVMGGVKIKEWVCTETVYRFSLADLTRMSGQAA